MCVFDWVFCVCVYVFECVSQCLSLFFAFSCLCVCINVCSFVRLFVCVLGYREVY